MANRQTFTWLPTFESEKTQKSKVSVLKLGDGYEQRQENGLNSRYQEWSLTFRYPYTIANKLDDFLTERGGIESFFWVTPRNQKLIFVCDEHRVKRFQGHADITCTFRQVFEA
jgi:phage-related protein